MLPSNSSSVPKVPYSCFFVMQHLNWNIYSYELYTICFYRLTKFDRFVCCWHKTCIPLLATILLCFNFYCFTCSQLSSCLYSSCSMSRVLLSCLKHPANEASNITLLCLYGFWSKLPWWLLLSSYFIFASPSYNHQNSSCSHIVLHSWIHCRCFAMYGWNVNPLPCFLGASYV